MKKCIEWETGSIRTRNRSLLLKHGLLVSKVTASNLLLWVVSGYRPFPLIIQRRCCSGGIHPLIEQRLDVIHQLAVGDGTSWRRRGSYMTHPLWVAYFTIVLRRQRQRALTNAVCAGPRGCVQDDINSTALWCRLIRDADVFGSFAETITTCPEKRRRYIFASNFVECWPIFKNFFHPQTQR